MSTDYYATLGVSKTASDAEIKKAYHKLAMEWHPDRRKGDKQAEQKFKEINEAYEILKDPQKRAAYDQYGSAAFSQGGFSGNYGPSSRSGFEGFEGGFGGFEDILNSMFGGRYNSRRSATIPGSDVSYDLSISLEEAFSGTTSLLKFRIFCPCDTCGGSGSKDKKSSTCPVCKGAGVVTSQQGFMTMQRTCSHCGGMGTILEHPCSDCGGTGRVYKDKNLEVQIPKGVDEGTRIRLSKEGEAGIRGGGCGDLYVNIHIKKHSIFKRQEKTLVCSVPLSMTTAILGGEIEIATLDKRKLSLKVPSGIQTGTRLKMKGEGMPGLRGGAPGDMLVEVIVETPVNLTARQKELLNEFEEEGKKVNNSPNSQGFFQKLKKFFSLFFVVFLAGCSVHRVSGPQKTDLEKEGRAVAVPQLEPSVVDSKKQAKELYSARRTAESAEFTKAVSAFKKGKKGGQKIIRVNKAVITEVDILARCKMMEEFTQRKSPNFTQLVRPQVEQRLIDEILYEQMAEKFKMDLSESMVEEQFENQATRFGFSKQEFKKRLQKHGIYDTFMAHLRGNLIESYISMMALPKDFVRVSEKAIDRALKQEKKEAAKTKYSVFEIVFCQESYPDTKEKSEKTNEKMAKDMYKELQVIQQQVPLYQAFPMLAQQVSQGATAKQSGFLGWLTLDQMGGQMKETIKNLSVGSFSKPVAFPNGSYKIFFLNDRKNPGKVPNSQIKIKLAVVSIPFKQDFPQEKQVQINRRIATFLTSQSLKEFESIAKDFHYEFRVVERKLSDLPDFIQKAGLNVCQKPIFTGESLDLCWVLSKVQEEVKDFIPDRKAVQQSLEQEKKVAYADKLFKDFKNRAFIQR